MIDDRRRRLVVVDAPGGIHPSTYLPALLDEFDIDLLWLAVEGPAVRERRRMAVGVVAGHGGSLVSVAGPEELPDALEQLLGGRHVDGVLALSERVVHVAQQKAGEHHLPANDADALRNLRDKTAQRAALADAGLPVPASRALATKADVRCAASLAQFPAVLKPSIGMGSLATFRIERAADLPSAWEAASALLAADSRVSHLGPVLVLEDELPGDPAAAHGGLGDYLSVECLTTDGHTTVLAVGDKLPLSEPFRENGHLLPAIRSRAEQDQVADLARRAHEALGVTFGVTHTEVKITPDGPRIIEVNGRPGGGVCEMFRLTSGYDLVADLARVSVGIAPHLDIDHRATAAYLTLQPPAGRHYVDRAPTADELRALTAVRDVPFVVAPGTVLDSDDGTASNIVRLLAVSEDPRELIELAERVRTGLFELVPDPEGR